MDIKPVTELGSGGALRLPRARAAPQSAPPSSYTAAVERYLTGAGIAKSSARTYRISLTTWGWMLAGEPAPTGPARRGAKPPAFPIRLRLMNPEIAIVWADSAYAGKLVDWAKQHLNLTIKPVSVPRTFVERTFGWLMHHRRLAAATRPSLTAPKPWSTSP